MAAPIKCSFVLISLIVIHNVPEFVLEASDDSECHVSGSQPLQGTSNNRDRQTSTLAGQIKNLPIEYLLARAYVANSFEDLSPVIATARFFQQVVIQ